MTQRTCDLSDLTESAEALRAGPPWWLHAILFGLSVLLIVAAGMLFACLVVRT